MRLPTLDEIAHDPGAAEPLIPCALVLLAGVALLAFLVGAATWHWDIAGVLLVGLITAGVIWWQGNLIKRQIAFASLIEFDKEWNSPKMLKTRKNVRNVENQWDDSRLEGVAGSAARG